MESAAPAAVTSHFQLNIGQMDRQTDKQVENQMDRWMDRWTQNKSEVERVDDSGQLLST